MTSVEEAGDKVSLDLARISGNTLADRLQERSSRTSGHRGRT
jgi:hypothetical protein